MFQIHCKILKGCRIRSTKHLSAMVFGGKYGYNYEKTYVRVSSSDQNEERQIAAMHEYGMNEKCIVIEKQSGKDFNRPALKKL